MTIALETSRTSRSIPARRHRRCAMLALGIAAALASTALSTAAEMSPRAEPWFGPASAALQVPPPARMRDEANRSPATTPDLARARWWRVGGPGHRWNEIALETLLEDFVTLPMAARHLALVQAAVDDAVAAAWREKRRHAGARATAMPSYPSDFAAAAFAASGVLGELMPARAQALAARAQESATAGMITRDERPRDIEAGRELGRAAAGLAIQRARADGSDARWTGTVPTGPGLWQGANPIAPMAGTWMPWVLPRGDALRPPAPPAFDSPETLADLAELKRFARTPRSNHRATYWEVFGGARAHTLWNETLRTKLLERSPNVSPPAATRAMAALNIAMADAGVACWDAKYTYWRIRPPQLDPELKTVVPAPNHPSFPAAHGCFSTAAATVMAQLFPEDRDKLLAMGTEAAEARIWAGIHFRSDIDAGRTIGRQVGERTLERAFLRGSLSQAR